jgi:hypothetical protein
MSAIIFESLVRDNKIEIPAAYRREFSAPVRVTIVETGAERATPRILPRRGTGPITEASFTPFIDTDHFKFNREEANER